MLFFRASTGHWKWHKTQQVGAERERFSWTNKRQNHVGTSTTNMTNHKLSFILVRRCIFKNTTVTKLYRDKSGIIVTVQDKNYGPYILVTLQCYNKFKTMNLLSKCVALVLLKDCSILLHLTQILSINFICIPTYMILASQTI